MSMNGIDISNWQKGINVAAVPCDFVICKATQGTNYVNADCDRAYQQAKAEGKCLGVYHYAGGGGAVAEAEYFLKNIQGYIGEAILVLDWEENQNSNFYNSTYAKQFLDHVCKQTGIKPLIYMSKSVCRQFDWASVAKADYGLWVAQYANMNQTGYKSNPWTDNKGYGAWPNAAIFQYSSCGRLSGYNGDLDLNVAYMDAAAWKKYAGTSSTTAPPTPVQPQKKTNEQVADEVLSGRWGDGEARRKGLTEAGYDYDAVQRIVNRKSEKNSSVYYIVKSGDTLSGIAAKYGTNYKALATLNGINNPNKIFMGQKIRIK